MLMLSASIVMTMTLVPLTAFAHGGAFGSGNSHAGRGGQASQEASRGSGNPSSTSGGNTAHNSHQNVGGQASQGIPHGNNNLSSATNGRNMGNSQQNVKGNATQESSYGDNAQSSHNAQATKKNTFILKNKGLVNQLSSIPNHPTIPTLPKSIKNNKTVKSLLITNQQLQHTIIEKEKVLKKDMQTLLSQLTSPSSNQPTSTSLQTVDKAVQKAVNLGKSLTTRSNKGGMEKGLVRALAMLKANETGMKKELSSLTTAIQKIEALLQQSSPVTTVTGAVYGTNGSSSVANSSTTTSASSST